MTKRDIQKEETLKKLRQAIRELVKEVGYEHMTIRMICDRANVSTGAYYHHFKSKDDILFDNYMYMMLHFEKLYDDELKALKPIAALYRLLQELVSYTSTIIAELDIPYHRAFITEYPVWAEKYPDILRWIMHDCFYRAAEQGLLKDGYTPKQRGDMLWNMYIGTKIIYCTIGQSFFDETKIRHQFREWIDSICNQSL